MRSGVAWALVVGISVSVAARDAVQTAAPSSSQTPQFRAAVDLVELDVSVLDKDRHPVRGLTAQDFTILEDGKPQPVASFAAVDLPDPVPPSAAWMNDVPGDVVSNDLEDRRLFVIFIDDALMGDSNISFKRKISTDAAVRLIDGLGPGDLAAVVFSWSDRSAQSFTSDHALLRQAAMSVEPGPPGGQGCLAVWSSTGVLRSIVEMLADIPHRRKAVINIGPGAPVRGGGSGPCEPRMEDDEDVMLAAAQRGNVNIYGLDPGGLRVKGDIRTGDFLLAVANDTGARVIMNTNDPAGEVPQILAENSSYYLLGYAPANGAADGKFRRLDVRVDRPGVEVRTRKNYIAPKPPSTTAREATPAELAVSDILPKTDLRLSVTAAPFARPDGSASAAIVLHVREPRAGDRRTASIDVLTRAFTVDGRAGASDRRVASVRLPAARDPDAPADFEALSTVTLPPGRQSLRIAATDTDSKIAGSVYVDVVVPNFAKDRLSMSGVLLTANPALPGAPRDAFVNILPLAIAPTATREFAKTDDASAFLRVYQAAKSDPSPVTMHTTLRDAHDKVVRDTTSTIDAAMFRQIGAGPRERDVVTPLAVSALERGDYLLTVTASIGKTSVHGDVPFRVR